jgi:hypothetical protein
VLAAGWSGRMTEQRFGNNTAPHEIPVKREHRFDLAAGQHEVKRAIREIVQNSWTDQPQAGKARLLSISTAAQLF